MQLRALIQDSLDASCALGKLASPDARTVTLPDHPRDAAGVLFGLARAQSVCTALFAARAVSALPEVERFDQDADLLALSATLAALPDGRALLDDLHGIRDEVVTLLDGLSRGETPARAEFRLERLSFFFFMFAAALEQHEATRDALLPELGMAA